MKRVLIALGLAFVLVTGTVQTASALDGPWVGRKIALDGGGSAKATGRYLADTDVFKVCTRGPVTGVLKWRTATLKGRHKRSIYLGRGCSRFDHAFVRGARVEYRVCAVIPDQVRLCSRWVYGRSTS